MATQKHKVQGYVEGRCFEAFTAFWQTNQLSQSQALEHLLNRALGVIGDVPKPFELEERVANLEEELHSLTGLVLAMRGVSLADDSNLNSNLTDESLPILEALKLVSPVVEPNELEVIQSNLDSDTHDLPVIEPDESEVIQDNLNSDTHDLPVIEPDESEVIQSNLNGDTHDLIVVEQDESAVIQSNLNGDTHESPVVEQDESEVIQSNLNSDADKPEDNLYVVCRYNDSSPDVIQFWNSRNGEFGYSFELCKRYKSDKVANRQMLKLLQDEQYYIPNRGWNIKFNSVTFFKKRLAEIKEQRNTVLTRPFESYLKC